MKNLGKHHVNEAIIVNTTKSGTNWNLGLLMEAMNRFFSHNSAENAEPETNPGEVSDKGK